MHQNHRNQGPGQFFYPLQARDEAFMGLQSLLFRKFLRGIPESSKGNAPAGSGGHLVRSWVLISPLTLSCARRRPEGTVEWATVEKVSTTADPELLALAGTPAVVNALREKYLRERAVRPIPTNNP